MNPLAISIPSTSHEIMVTLQALNRERGVTIIVVTHEPDIATYADRVITMRDGEVISDERKPARSRQHRPGCCPLVRFPPHSRRRLLPGVRVRCWAFAMMIVAAAFQALARNKMRSALTMLGVFIGVAALIAMVAVGQGANEAVRKQIESLGTNLLVVVPGATSMGGMRSWTGQCLYAYRRRCRSDCAGKLRRSAASAISSARWDRSSMLIRTGRRTFKASAPTIRRSPIGKSLPGRGISQEDDRQRRAGRGAGPDGFPSTVRRR